MTRSGTDGSFAFASLPDAVTILVARDEDVTTIAARVEVAVPEAGKKTIEITLPEPRPPLPVKVTDHRGRAIEAARQDGAREFHFLRGQEVYKYEWGAVDRRNRRRSFLRHG